MHKQHILLYSATWAVFRYKNIVLQQQTSMSQTIVEHYGP